MRRCSCEKRFEELFETRFHLINFPTYKRFAVIKKDINRLAKKSQEYYGWLEKNNLTEKSFSAIFLLHATLPCN